MKEVIVTGIFATLLFLYGQEQYKRGVQSEQYDRESANIKLQNCSEVITKFNLEH